MDAEHTRAFLLTLPHVVETASDSARWGSRLQFRVGDQAAGGKMFAQFYVDDDRGLVMSFAAGPERYHELLELDGVAVCPYRARLHWVALERWDALRRADLEALLRHAHAIAYAKLPKRTKQLLERQA